MNITERSLLTVELLESRDCPSTVAAVIGGNLMVFSDSATLNISQMDGDSYNVNGQVRHGVTGSLFVNVFGFNSHTVDVDFNGHGTIRNVTITFSSLGSGSNTLTIHEGAIAGSLFVAGGLNKDTVNLGKNSEGLVIHGAATINLFSGTDALSVKTGTTLNGNLRTSLIENVTLDAGSTLNKSAFFSAGLFEGNNYNLNGDVDGSVWYTGGFGNDKFNLGATGSIGVDLAIALLSGTDRVKLDGGITRNLSITSGVFGGNKNIILSGIIGNHADVYLGWGHDRVTFDDLSSLRTATVQLGAGNDFFSLHAGAVITGGLGSAKIKGGGGFDTFMGTAAPAYLFVSESNFEAHTLV